ncbi:TetR/AcrR family transcriptional regulator [Phaeobacter sp. 11ANDIMAR09]|uniref:TetR/AcrR family transcriptional regulator n=1 Tax=Phaeobacter sp. 11ANDIMAR09 TaxID=1225647 RepID=UPI0006C850B2|nr:TetR/AcrR family transcriptional regulator [Phaeobacter sp. 11ANDIMAR09]KPD11485.1 transcriptional regulator [Phaeobacter sp. 11ANDIMAR09]
MTKPDTRSRLLDAAERQVRQKGADGFSYSDLSAEVGIRKASIHYHFPAKSDLLHAIMARYAKQVAMTLERYAIAMPLPRQALIAFVRFYRQALQEGHGLCLCVAFTVGRDALSPETRQEICQFRATVQSWLELRFEQLRAEGSDTGWSAEPKAEAAATLALVEGAQLVARSSANLVPFDAATASFLERLKAGG